MATLLHHIQSWMQKTITESEARIERKIHQFTERKIAEVNQRLDAFELRVLARPAPPVDVSTLQAAVDSLREYIDTILEARGQSLSSLLRTMYWRPCLLHQKFPDLPLEKVQRGVGVDQRIRREQERRSAVRWRLRGEPHLLRRRHTKSEHRR